MQPRVLRDSLKFNMENIASHNKLLLKFGSIALALLLLTHCFTTIRYLVQRSYDRRFRGKEPLTLPYVLPGVGSALSLITNPHGFFDSIV